MNLETHVHDALQLVPDITRLTFVVRQALSHKIDSRVFEGLTCD